MLTSYLLYEGSIGAICEQFPNIDRKIVRKVHKEMVREALAGEYADIEMSDSDFEALFISKAMQYT